MIYIMLLIYKNVRRMIAKLIAHRFHGRLFLANGFQWALASITAFFYYYYADYYLLFTLLSLGLPRVVS